MKFVVYRDIFIQIFTPSEDIGHISDEHHMHEYSFLILFCIYSTVYLQPRYTSDALYLKENHQSQSFRRTSSVSLDQSSIHQTI